MNNMDCMDITPWFCHMFLLCLIDKSVMPLVSGKQLFLFCMLSTRSKIEDHNSKQCKKVLKGDVDGVGLFQ